MQAHSSLTRLIDASNGLPISLVGGVVRDTLLDRDFGGDLDVVVEGDALALAGRAGRAMNARVVTHGRFGTAVVELPHDQWIDIVTARRESYATPGALPDVESGTLDEDLRRRDFSINALAYRLNGPDAGAVIDPTGGRRDLEDGLIRTLHPESFVEDPSRLLRAVRYAARLGFRLESGTFDAARSVAPALDPSNARVGEELRRLLMEDRAAAALELAARLGVPWIVPDVAALRPRFSAVDVILASRWAPDVPAWAVRMGLALTPQALAQVAVDGWARGIAQTAAEADDLAARLSRAERPSQIDAILHGAAPAATVVASADGAREVERWWEQMRGLELAISGAHLVRAGVAPGPAIGRALARVRERVLDGEIGHGAEEQLAAALEHLAA